MNDTERIAMLRKGLEDLGGAIMSVKDHNTPEWMEYIKDKIKVANEVLEATQTQPPPNVPPSDDNYCHSCGSTGTMENLSHCKACSAEQKNPRV